MIRGNAGAFPEGFWGTAIPQLFIIPSRSVKNVCSTHKHADVNAYSWCEVLSFQRTCVVATVQQLNCHCAESHAQICRESAAATTRSIVRHCQCLALLKLIARLHQSCRSHFNDDALTFACLLDHTSCIAECTQYCQNALLDCLLDFRPFLIDLIDLI